MTRHRKGNSKQMYALTIMNELSNIVNQLCLWQKVHILEIEYVEPMIVSLRELHDEVILEKVIMTLTLNINTHELNKIIRILSK